MTADRMTHHPGCAQSDGRRRLARGAAAVSLFALFAGQAQAVSIGPHDASRSMDRAVVPAITTTLDREAVAPVGPERVDVPLSSEGSDAVSLGDVFAHESSIDGSPQDVAEDLPGDATSLVATAQDQTPGVGPMVDYGHERATATSLIEVLRSVATLQGEPAKRSGPAPANQGRRARGASVPLGSLREVVLELLDEHISPLGTVDGKTVFSILGAGLFTLEVARDGSGVRLSELGSGSSIELGAGPEGIFGQSAERRPETEPEARREAGAEGGVPLGGADGLEQKGLLTSLLSAIADSLSFIGEFVADIVSSPFMVLLLLPLVLVWLVIDVFRQRMTGESFTPSVPAGTTSTVAPAPAPDLAAPTPARSGRRRKRRKRVRWRAVFNEVRSSLGFPQAELVRESDERAKRRGRRHRRRIIVG